MLEESKEVEILEKELEIDEQRIKLDEKRVKNTFFIIAICAVVIIANLAVIYSFILKPQTIISEKTSNPTPATTNSPTISPTPFVAESSNISNSQTSKNNIKDYFISFGSGTSSSSDWIDVEGLQVSFDLGDYANIKEVRFEVSTQIPTGNQIIWIRLYNKTDSHPVWNSEVSANGASSYSVSEPIIYDKGRKTYQVQMKTQLKYPANVTQSRIHVSLN